MHIFMFHMEFTLVRKKLVRRSLTPHGRSTISKLHAKEQPHEVASSGAEA